MNHCYVGGVVSAWNETVRYSHSVSSKAIDSCLFSQIDCRCWPNETVAAQDPVWSMRVAFHWRQRSYAVMILCDRKKNVQCTVLSLCSQLKGLSFALTFNSAHLSGPEGTYHWNSNSRCSNSHFQGETYSCIMHCRALSPSSRFRNNPPL